MPFADGSVAGVVCFYGIVHFTRAQVQQGFQEAYRALSDGGLFLLTFHVGNECIHITEFMNESIDVDFYLFPPAEIVQELQDTGFVEIAVVERDPYPDVEYPSRRAYVLARKTHSE